MRARRDHSNSDVPVVRSLEDRGVAAKRSSVAKPSKICAQSDCDRPVRAGSLCNRHYHQRCIAARPLGWCKGVRHGQRRPLDPRGFCVGCAVTQNANTRRDRLFAQLFGPIRGASPWVATLRNHLRSHRSPHRVRTALAALEPPVRRYLVGIRRRAITWESLQPLRIYAGGQWLITACLRAGVVMPPVADTARVERELRRMERFDRRAQRIVQRYWNERRCARLEVRKHYKRRDPTLESDRSSLWIAFDFLRFAVKRGTAAEAITQRDVTVWQIACESSRPTTPRRQGRELRLARSHVSRLKPFLDWLFETRIVSRRLELPTGKISAGTSVTPDVLQALERRARFDERVPLAVRVALLLIIMCARYPHELIALRLREIRKEQRGKIVWVQFPKGHAQPLEGQDAALILRLVRERRAAKCEWLFRSKPRPETHLSSNGLSGLIDEAGIKVNLNHLRNAAFRDSLKDFTPSEAAEIRGMRQSVAQHWEKRGYTVSHAEREYVNDLSRRARRRRRVGRIAV